MEMESDYQNVEELFECQSGRVGGNGESMKPECHVRPMDLARRNLSLSVIYVLLGVCILLSVVAIVTTVMLISGNHEKTLSTFVKLQDEISQLNKNTTKSIADMKNKLSQWKSNDLLRCPTGWTQFWKSCYNFSSSTKTWAEAQSHCASVDAHLIVINNAGEQDFLKKNLQNRYWIGLSDTESEGDWRWVDGTDYSSNFKNWSDGEPNDDNSVEDCAETFDDGKWNDMPCSDNQRWICERSALIASSI